ncbi:hypothetical protein [Georgenia faecalis]|uniref:DUF8094 domain-containing protein n=1 Tax=Georgenia faecalis TaxID=2483799 RepID=A0ABV9DCH3_9MICO|nr:hypothetical protein [Georgenia faecalis]
MTTNSWTRRGARTAAAAVVVLSLGACAGEVPQPDPDPVASTPAPVLDEDRIDRVLADIDETIAEADAALDPALLAERFSGPALAMREAEYRLAAASDGEYTPTPLTTDSQVEVVAATDTWPRTVLVVSHPPEGSNLPLLIALTQPDARSQYTVWLWTRLLPGVATPPTANPETGSTPLAGDAEGLRATPDETLAAYAETLNNPDSANAGLFAEDAYKTAYREELTTLAATIEAAGSVARTNEVIPGSVAALSTSDGGAIVVGALRSQLTLSRTVEGATLHAGGSIGTLLGDDTIVENAVDGVYDVTLAFHVPPADSDEPIEVLGADQILVEVVEQE